MTKFSSDIMPDMGPSVVERPDGWYWATECWEWHGPHSSKASATDRQHLYCRYEVEGGAVPPLKTKEEWLRSKEEKRENEIHPCSCYEPWDCDCAGACGCHFAKNASIANLLEVTR